MSLFSIMDVKKNEDGQSLIEFMVFLPFLVMMYSVTVSLGSAINASINQQKATRGYTYYRLANNSMFPRPSRGNGSEATDAWSIFGTHVVGWAEKLESNKPVAPCFKFILPLGDGAETDCGESYTTNTTQFIRVKTVYGICGITYLKTNNERISFPRSMSRGAVQHCISTN